MNEKGLTLIELIVTLGLLGIIMSLIFSIFIFGIKTYDKGVAQSNIQEDIRFTSHFITNEMRKCKEVYSQRSDLPSNIETYHIIEFNSSSLIKTTLDKNDNIITVKELPYKFLNITFSLKDKNILLFKISSKLKKQEFEVTNQVLINNLLDSKAKVSDFNNVNKIYYLK